MSMQYVGSHILGLSFERHGCVMMQAPLLACWLQVVGPPIKSLGVQELELTVHNGDCITVHDTDWIVQALSIRFKLVILLCFIYSTAIL